MTPSPPAIHTDGAVSAGVVLWRFRGRLQLTAVVKAVFAILPDGVAAQAGPGEIVAADRHVEGSPLRSLEAPGELAPYLPRCDVLFTGHAHAPGGAAAGSVRLGISRDGSRLIDKTIHVYGDRGPSGAPGPFARMPIVYERAVGGRGAPNPIGTGAPNLADPEDARRPAGFGPIPRLWPVRRAALGSIDPRALAAPIVEIPEGMPWEYFQAAPRDQQIDPLRGGEWLVLDGLHPTLARVQTRLPAARAAARVEPAVKMGDTPMPPDAAVPLVCDMLIIDGDRQTFSLVWRGRYEVAEGEAALSSLVVLSALEAPGVPVDWARVRAAPAIEPHAKGAARVLVGDGTVAVRPEEAAANASKAATPFGPSGAPARPPSTAATPWSAEPLRPVPVPALGGTTIEPQASPIRRRAAPGTMALPAMDEADLAQRSAVPFPISGGEPTHAGAGEEIPGAPWSRIAAPPVARREQEADTADLDPLDPADVALIEAAVAAAPPSEPPPPPSLKTPLPPPPDPWARAPAAPAPVQPPAPPPPPAFDRPAAAAVKGSFYAKFAKK